MTECFELGLSYSALNSIRSALSTYIVIDKMPVGSHPILCRFMKGTFNIRPALPRNNFSWDTATVLKYLQSLSPVKKLTLKVLTCKVVTLTALLTAQRNQSLHLMDVRNTVCSKDRIIFRFGDKMKQSRPGFHLGELIVKAYAPDRRLCLCTALLEYLSRTSGIRQSDNLFVTVNKPHKSASQSTIARWIKLTLKLAGIDTDIFTPHSTRGAASSAARRANVPIDTILKTAGWSSSSTFAKYYNKPLAKGGEFGRKINELINNAPNEDNSVSE